MEELDWLVVTDLLLTVFSSKRSILADQLVSVIFPFRIAGMATPSRPLHGHGHV
jgi:hypothetical protein